MAISVIDIFDATTRNVASLPPGHQVAGYTTGTGIRWTPDQFNAHTTPFPAVRIDQDAGAADPTADVLDVERGAATVAEIPGWLTLARASFHTAMRPGQRWPAIYCSIGTLNDAIAACQKAGIHDAPFAIAELTNRTDAVGKVSTAAGPFPRIWHQYAFGQAFDSGIVSVDWLKNVSGKVAVTPQVPPGQWKDPKSWSWAAVGILGVGLNGELYAFTYDPATGKWTGPIHVPKA